MSYQVAVDRDGREWAVLAIDSGLKARLLHGAATPAVINLDRLVEMHGPLTLVPICPAAAGMVAALTDTVCLVAADPETASIDQIRQVAAFAQSIVAPHGS